MSRIYVLYAGIALICVATGVVIWHQSGSVNRLFKKEVAEKFRTGSPVVSAQTDVVTEADIAPLPQPVPEYLRYAGVVGKSRVRTEQYDFFDDLTRIFNIKGKMLGIPVVGRDLYAEGRGNMIIKIAGLIAVADAKGPDMDRSGLVTMFNDMCLLTPATLIDRRIQWEPVDPLTARGTLEHGGKRVSATLFFNEKAELVDFVTDDRYYAPTGETPKRVRWSTPAHNYRDFAGLKIMSLGEGVWHFEEGECPYARFNLREVEYNLEAAAER